MPKYSTEVKLSWLIAEVFLLIATFLWKKITEDLAISDSRSSVKLITNAETKNIHGRLGYQ